MNLDEADMAPELELNEIIWRSVRGADSPMPPPRRAAFVVAAAPETMTTSARKPNSVEGAGAQRKGADEKDRTRRAGALREPEMNRDDRT